MIEIAQDEKRALRDLVWMTIKYTPTAAQEVFHADQRRLKLVAGGIRAGKSYSTAMEFVGECAVKNGLIWIVGPDYAQGKAEFKYLYDAFNLLGWIAKESMPEKGAQVMTLSNGCRIETKSSDDTRALASFAPNAILMVEAGQQTLETYYAVQERALEHNAKVVLSGTFEGAISWYAETYLKWQATNQENARSFSIPTWTNTVKFPGGRNDQKIKDLENSMPPELFAERCGAVPYKPAGLVHRVFDHARNVAELAYDPTWPIELAIDPAQHTYACLAIQWKKQTLAEWWYTDKLAQYKRPDDISSPDQFSREQLAQEWTRVRVIDEIYEHNITAQDLIPLVMARPWFKALILRNAGTIDIAGTHRQANLSQTRIWQDIAGCTFRHKFIFVEESINVVNVRLKGVDPLGVPLLQFSHKMRQDKGMDGKAMGLIAEMGLYKYPPWNEGGNVTNKPVDANNDASKALAYWLYDRFGPVVERRKRRQQQIRRVYWK